MPRAAYACDATLQCRHVAVSTAHVVSMCMHMSRHAFSPPSSTWQDPCDLPVSSATYGRHSATCASMHACTSHRAVRVADHQHVDIVRCACHARHLCHAARARGAGR
eukprot:360328-Chlamydomonas_euryale.AAC.18